MNEPARAFTVHVSTSCAGYFILATFAVWGELIPCVHSATHGAIPGPRASALLLRDDRTDKHG